MSDDKPSAEAMAAAAEIISRINGGGPVYWEPRLEAARIIDAHVTPLRERVRELEGERAEAREVVDRWDAAASPPIVAPPMHPARERLVGAIAAALQAAHARGVREERERCLSHLRWELTRGEEDMRDFDGPDDEHGWGTEMQGLQNQLWRHLIKSIETGETLEQRMRRMGYAPKEGPDA